MYGVQTYAIKTCLFNTKQLNRYKYLTIPYVWNAILPCESLFCYANCYLRNDKCEMTFANDYCERLIGTRLF